jgi:hypothetical protein
MADLQAMVAWQQEALAKEEADRKVEMALRIAETHRLEEQLENQKAGNRFRHIHRYV